MLIAYAEWTTIHHCSVWFRLLVVEFELMTGHAESKGGRFGHMGRKRFGYVNWLVMVQCCLFSRQSHILAARAGELEFKGCLSEGMC